MGEKECDSENCSCRNLKLQSDLNNNNVSLELCKNNYTIELKNCALLISFTSHRSTISHNTHTCLSHRELSSLQHVHMRHIFIVVQNAIKYHNCHESKYFF